MIVKVCCTKPLSDTTRSGSATASPGPRQCPSSGSICRRCHIVQIPIERCLACALSAAARFKSLVMEMFQLRCSRRCSSISFVVSRLRWDCRFRRRNTCYLRRLSVSHSRNWPPTALLSSLSEKRKCNVSRRHSNDSAVRGLHDSEHASCQHVTSHQRQVVSVHATVLLEILYRDHDRFFCSALSSWRRQRLRRFTLQIDQRTRTPMTQEREREVRRMLPHRKHPCAFRAEPTLSNPTHSIQQLHTATHRKPLHHSPKATHERPQP